MGIFELDNVKMGYHGWHRPASITVKFSVVCRVPCTLLHRTRGSTVSETDLKPGRGAESQRGLREKAECKVLQNLTSARWEGMAFAMRRGHVLFFARLLTLLAPADHVWQGGSPRLLRSSAREGFHEAAHCLP